MSNTKLSFLSRGFFSLTTLIALLGCQPEFEHLTHHNTWSHYGGRPDQSNFFESPGSTKSDVGEMEVLRTYPSGDDRFYFCSPIIVDTTMYVVGKNNSLIALTPRMVNKIMPFCPFE